MKKARRNAGYTAAVRQRGAVLIVGMIMLLLLTLLGVAGMRDTLLQEKMTGNMRDRETAFQSAEAALREAEGRISGSTKITMTNGTSGLYARATLTDLYRTYSNAAVSETKYWKTYSWINNGACTNSVQYSASNTSGQLPNVAQQPCYVIEELPGAMSPVAGSTNGGTTTGKTITDYRITARGVGLTTDAVVILQSVYRRTD
ncbi:MAG TPA: PilX N-terminal domain-containing pilus assembly protein [Pseudomonadales bacterium]|nr:PilX N-terminal domain-containing pilus assembly protein [Pseudomonadales bacterium]